MQTNEEPSYTEPTKYNEPINYNEPTDYNKTTAFTEPIDEPHLPLPLVTIALAVINTLIFIYTDLICDNSSDMIQAGGLSYLFITEDRQWYRFLTSMFLHLDLDHIFNNMVVLLATGYYLEHYLGHLRYGILYFLSGLLAGGTSIVYNMMLNDPTISVGASGAIFGLLGGLIVAVISIGRRTGHYDLYQLGIMVVLNLYVGFANPQVDNAAHIGGLVFGIILCLILSHRHSVDMTPYREQ